LFYTLRAAHLDTRGPHRLFAVYPAAHLLVHGGVQIPAQFLIHFALDLLLAEQSPQTTRQISQQ